MNDLMGMHEMAGPYELHHEEASLRLSETASSTEHVHQALRGNQRPVLNKPLDAYSIITQLEGHIDILIILKTFVKSDDIGVLQ